ncbi:MAG TPA: hypothetical protein VHG71_10985 [Verrucomicrobiae bacterium]|nr:hypothetical protein [Verrucomicrobiae bacterium]
MKGKVMMNKAISRLRFLTVMQRQLGKKVVGVNHSSVAERADFI